MKSILFLICVSITLPLQSTQIDQVSLLQFIQRFPDTRYLQCTNNYQFHHQPYPLYPEHLEKMYPANGMHANIFILEIPNGIVYYDITQYMFLNNCFIQELQCKNINYFYGENSVQRENIPTIYKLSGRLAVVSQVYNYNYALWVLDVLSQLALLEIFNIDYDYLYIPCSSSFMLEALDLWGIDRNKIIPVRTDHDLCFQADSVFISTAIAQDFPTIIRLANYYPDFLLQHIRKKLLAGVAAKNVSYNFAEKIFISRKDADGKRAIPNEDEVFALFQPLGFKRYTTSNLSMAEKISLFHNAKTIISFVGAGCTNILFCKPGAHYIEITQRLIEATFFYIADTFNLKYSNINDSTIQDFDHECPVWAAPTALSLEKVKEFIAQHPEL